MKALGRRYRGLRLPRRRGGPAGDRARRRCRCGSAPRRLAAEPAWYRWHVSLTHTDQVAMAVVVAEGGGRPVPGPPTAGRRRRSAKPCAGPTVAEMRAADAPPWPPRRSTSWSTGPGTAVAGAALALLGGAYGRRVVVVAGKGNNGADGRVAAAAAGRRGARVTVIDAADAPPARPRCDLVIDAAYGTGFRGTYDAPPVPAGDPGAGGGHPLGGGRRHRRGRRAARGRHRTVTFAALKPGLLQADGPELAGR